MTGIRSHRDLIVWQKAMDLSIAKGSLMETETFLMLAVRLKYVSQNEAATASALLTEISKMLTSLCSRLREETNLQ